MVRSEIPSNILALQSVADTHAIECSMFLDEDDVIVVDEAQMGGVDDIYVLTREDAINSDRDSLIATMLGNMPRGLALVICDRTGTPWVTMSALALLNAPGGVA